MSAKKPGPTKVLYVRIPTELHQAATEFARGAGMSLSTAVSALLGHAMATLPPSIDCRRYPRRCLICGEEHDR